MCSQDQWNRGQSESLLFGKKSRFRFCDAEKIKSLKELFNILCENNFETENELWENLRSVLIHDNPRFQNCTVRLLRDHMLEQVSKFRKYDAEEATESGKERLRTEWGETMHQLMIIWCNYEDIVRLDTQKKQNNRMGRPRKDTIQLNSQSQSDSQTAKAIREAALQNISTSESIQNYEVFDIESNLSVVEERQASDTNINDVHNYARTPTTTTTERRNTLKASKSRNSKDDGVFLYLAEKMRTDNEYKKEELNYKVQQHNDNIALQKEELAYKRAKLEFEERKWKDEAECRRANTCRNDTMMKILESMFMSGYINQQHKD